MRQTLLATVIIAASSMLGACGGGSGDNSTSSAQIAAAQSFVITSGPPPEGTVGSAYDHRRCGRGGCGGFSFSAMGGVQQSGVTWSWAAEAGSSLPPGLTVSGAMITGTPTEKGAYRVVVTAADTGSSATASAHYALTIVNPPPPVVSTSPPPQGATLGQPYSFNFFASGIGVNFSATGTLPPGLAPVTPDGVLAGTPTATGTFPIVLHAVDVVGQTATQDFAVEVFAHGFALVGSLHDARDAHTATLLSSGQVLIAGGSQSISSAELYDPATRTFSATASMTIARANHSATLLCDLTGAACANSRVLIAGGFDGTNILASAELFDPAKPGFTATGNMSVPRLLHSATILPGGKVLIAGGIAGGTDANCGNTLASAELYDPVAGTFTVTGAMATARYAHTATLLANGQVLIAGGRDVTTSPTASAELYDSTSGTFTATASLQVPRAGHTAVALPTGEVLVAGGFGLNGNGLKHAELFDPTAAAFSSTGGMQIDRYSHTMTVLGASGQVLVTGGIGNGAATSAEVYQ